MERMTRQGVRDLSTIGPKRLPRNRRIEEIPKQAPMPVDEWAGYLHETESAYSLRRLTVRR